VPDPELTSAAPPETFARFFESVHEGVYIGTLSESAALTLSANPYLKLMFGYAVETPQEEVRPFDIERFVDPQARDGFVERLRRDGAITDYLLRLRRADRSPMWVEVTAHAERVAEGLRIEALMRDVSERKRLEDQARDLYHQLLQAEKLAALGQTISGVAHELNNPLATILTWAERLAQRSVDEPTKRGLETILSESERAAKIVRNLLLGGKGIGIDIGEFHTRKTIMPGRTIGNQGVPPLRAPAFGNAVPLKDEMRYAGLAQMLAHGQPGLSTADHKRVNLFNRHALLHITMPGSRIA